MENPDLRQILQKYGFDFKKSLGQNFLTDRGLLRAIVRDAGVQQTDTVIEIGTGAGTLTAELAAAYFDDYAVREIEHAGDVIRDGMTFYNFTLRDERGREIYAQIAKAGGKLVMFDSYEKCMANNFSQEECVEIGSAFLQKLGMEHMHAVWLQENGTTANINFVYEQDGVLCYSDLVTVKVCETKGKVVGMEALPYYLNHCERTVRAAGISLEEAADALGIL